MGILLFDAAFREVLDGVVAVQVGRVVGGGGLVEGSVSGAGGVDLQFVPFGEHPVHLLQVAHFFGLLHSVHRFHLFLLQVLFQAGDRCLDRLGRGFLRLLCRNAMLLDVIYRL